MHEASILKQTMDSMVNPVWQQLCIISGFSHCPFLRAFKMEMPAIAHHGHAFLCSALFHYTINLWACIYREPTPPPPRLREVLLLPSNLRSSVRQHISLQAASFKAEHEFDLGFLLTLKCNILAAWSATNVDQEPTTVARQLSDLPNPHMMPTSTTHHHHHPCTAFLSSCVFTLKHTQSFFLLLALAITPIQGIKFEIRTLNISWVGSEL